MIIEIIKGYLVILFAVALMLAPLALIIINLDNPPKHWIFKIAFKFAMFVWYQVVGALFLVLSGMGVFLVWKYFTGTL